MSPLFQVQRPGSRLVKVDAQSGVFKLAVRSHCYVVNFPCYLEIYSVNSIPAYMKCSDNPSTSLVSFKLQLSDVFRISFPLTIIIRNSYLCLYSGITKICLIVDHSL